MFERHGGGVRIHVQPVTNLLEMHRVFFSMLSKYNRSWACAFHSAQHWRHYSSTLSNCNADACSIRSPRAPKALGTCDRFCLTRLLQKIGC